MQSTCTDFIRSLDYHKTPYIFKLDGKTVWSFYKDGKFCLQINYGNDIVKEIDISEDDFNKKYNIIESNDVLFNGGGYPLILYNIYII